VSKHIIFFAAGIGDDVKGWSTRLRKSFQEKFDSYPLPPGGLPFDELFETEEILYNDFFDEWRKRVAQEADSALKLLGAEGLPSDTVKKLLEAGVSTGGGGFQRTHALDVLQYRFLMLVSEAVRDTVQHQIMQRLTQTDFGTPVRWSIITHSLGTVVVHDALHRMFMPGPGSEESALFQPFAVVMLANVSQLLHNVAVLGNGVDAYSSVVHPNRDPELGACRYYLSAANELDPVALAGNFDPPQNWITEQARTQRRFRPLKFKAIPKSGNVHGYDEYLAHPAVHVPLFRILSGDQDRISDAKENDAHKAYEAANPLPGLNDVKRGAIEKLGERAAKSDWFERISAWKDVLERFTRK
jgi:hypothetical protein